MNDTHAGGAARIAKQPLVLTINGKLHELLVEPRRTLLQLLREDLHLTGAKEVCLLGSCGACTVLIDDKPALSCITLALGCRNKSVTTIEGLARDGVLHPLQQSFIDKGAVQCGYCTSGMIMTGKALLDENPQPTAAQARRAISGNLCRCTGYEQIVEAIVAAGTASAAARCEGADAPRAAGEFLMPETGE